MATTAITPVSLEWNIADVSSLVFTAPTTAADGFLVDFTKADQKTVLLFYNSSADTARTFTVKAGDGIQAASDLPSGEIAAGAYALVSVESGAFKITQGDDRGKLLVIPSHEELKMAAVVLP